MNLKSFIIFYRYAEKFSLTVDDTDDQAWNHQYQKLLTMRLLVFRNLIIKNDKHTIHYYTPDVIYPLHIGINRRIIF